MNELPQGASRDVIALLFGHPDPSTLMTPEFQQVVQTVMAKPHSFTALQYGNEQGTVALIQYLVEKLNREQGLSLTPANLMITTGSTGAVDMTARLFGQGGVVIVEAPTYADTLHVFRDHHVDLRSVPMEDKGLLTTELELLLARLSAEGKPPRILYTIPNFHNPTGITTVVERRQEILRLAERYGFLIVEDDVYRDLGFSQSTPPSYYALSGGRNVISVGSFSKTLAPGLRLGWIAATPEIITSCVNSGVVQMGGGANPFAAQMVAEFCTSGNWEAHIARLQALYQRRCETMLAALDRYMSAGITWTRPDGGFFLWITLPETIFAQDVKRVGLEHGVSLTAGGGFFVNPADGAHSLRLAFSYASLEDLDRGVQILADVIRSVS